MDDLPIYRLCRLLAAKAFRRGDLSLPPAELKKLSKAIGPDCELQNVEVKVDGNRCTITFVDASGGEPTYNCIQRSANRIEVPTSPSPFILIRLSINYLT